MTVTLVEFQLQARAWLDTAAPARPAGRTWAQGSDDVEIFPSWSPQEEVRQLQAGRDWLRARHAGGFGAISYPASVGGRELSRAHELVYQLEEGRYETPTAEIWSVSYGMVMPTILAAGTPEQQQRFVPGGVCGDLLFCQLFSEPDAGSDLAALRTSARRTQAGWVASGRKVWTSMARGADWGLLLARTETGPNVARRDAFTMFLLRMDQPGVSVNPIRQLTGGASFNEVVLDDVEVSDDCRVGTPGGGWGVMLTTLSNERQALPLAGPGGSVDRLAALAEHFGCLGDPRIRDDLASLYITRQVMDLNALRALAAVAAGGAPGPEGAIGKLACTDFLTDMAQFTSTVLGPALVADTDEWGTFAWSSHLLGGIGLHIGGGTDEIVKNSIAERVLGLPKQRRT